MKPKRFDEVMYRKLYPIEMFTVFIVGILAVVFIILDQINYTLILLGVLFGGFLVYIFNSFYIKTVKQ